MEHQSKETLEAGLDEIRQSPSDDGEVQMIVRRPAKGEREQVSEGEFSLSEGLVGDNWSTRGSSSTPDGNAHPEMQVNVMNARVAQLVAGSKERWKLAGDQLYVDLDLSDANLPAGTRLAIGEVILEITPAPHLGCLKFVDRFGKAAMEFVNSEQGKALNLRGVNAKVIQPGRVRTGDRACKLR